MFVRVIFTEAQQRQTCLRTVKGFEVKSAGTYVWALNPVGAELMEWADKIFVMEEEHRRFVVQQFPGAASKITVLDIEDNYYRDDPRLRAILKDKLEPYFNSP